MEVIVLVVLFLISIKTILTPCRFNSLRGLNLLAMIIGYLIVSYGQLKGDSYLLIDLEIVMIIFIFPIVLGGFKLFKTGRES